MGSLDNISVEPFPLVIATGEDITLNVQITLNEPIPAGATVSLKIKREGLIPIPIPCLPIGDISIGSCDYDGDELLASASDFLPHLLPRWPGLHAPPQPRVLRQRRLPHPHPSRDPRHPGRPLGRRDLLR